MSLFVSPNRVAAQGNLRFERVSQEQGLSHGMVLSTLQDRDGFLWFATADGLNRYDGYRFKVFKHDPDDPDSLSDSHVQTLFEDSRGILWIGTRKGLNRFERATETFIRYENDPQDPQSISDFDVMSITEDRHGELWIGTLGGGLNRFNREQSTFTHYRHDANNKQSLSDNEVYVVFEDHLGELWIGTRKGGLSRFDRVNKNFQHFQHDPDNISSISDNRVYTLLEDRDGNLWVGTRGGGLNRFNRDYETFAHFRFEPENSDSLSSDRVLSLFEDRDGILWIGTKEGGLNRYDKTNQHFVRYLNHPADPYSLSQNAIFSIFQDQSGILWIGTFGDGLNKLNPDFAKFGHNRRDPGTPNSLNDNHVLRLYQDKDDNIWIGTREGGLNRFDKSTGIYTNYRHNPADPNSVSDNTIYGIYQDSAGILWIGTDHGGLNRFDSEKGIFTQYFHNSQDPNSISGNEWVSAIIEDTEGSLWIGTRNGLNRFDTRRGTFKRYLHSSEDPESISDNSIATLYKDKAGTLWIGTRNGGLNRFNSTDETFSRYQHDPANANSLSHDTIYTISEDQSGILWIGTFGGGLNKFDQENNVFIDYREKNGLPDDHILGILNDQQGHLWISTYKGLSRFDPKKEIFKNYQVSDGLQSNQFNLSAYEKTRDGQLLFGGVNGFNVFYSEQIKEDLTAPEIVITDFLLFNRSVAIQRKNKKSPLKKSINQTDSLTLSHQDSVFSFEFAALHFANPTSNQYAYKLEGFNKDWIHTGADRRFATYTNLPSGDYKFQVKGSNKDGVWNDKGRSIQLTILPAPWRTWWAYLIYLLIFGSAVGFVFVERYRRASIRIEAAKQIEDSEERLSLALWGSREQLWDWDVELGLIHRRNILEEFNLPKIQKRKTVDDFAELMHQNDQKRYTEKLQQHLLGESEHFEAAYRLKNNQGEWTWVMDKGRVVSRTVDGEVIRMSGVMLNVHELYELNENLEQMVASRTIELQNSLDQLKKAQDQLVQSEKMAALGDLVAGVAHEVNTPLGICVTAISLQIETLEKLEKRYTSGEIRTSDLEDYLERSKEQMVLVERNIQRSSNLIKGFKQVAVDQTYEIITKFEFYQYLQTVVSSISPKLRATNHSIRVDVPKTIKLVAYPGVWAQIVTNLIDNSLMHGLSCDDTGLISIEAEEKGNSLRFYYRDNGKGMSESQVKRVFDPFYTTKRGEGGSGLGMHIVYNLVTQKLNGQIECMSVMGEGVTFMIDVPLSLMPKEMNKQES